MKDKAVIRPPLGRRPGQGGVFMTKYFLIIFLVGLLSFSGGGLVFGEVIPTSEWVAFYGTASTYNGQDIPDGSVIDAYDSSGIHCGTDTVGITGQYGFVNVYGDDGYGAGPQAGDPITFYVNNRLAVPGGPDDPVWTANGDRVEVNLSASAVISMEAIELPDDQTTPPGNTVRFFVTVKNTGEGLDFYAVTASSTHGWIIETAGSFVYALSGEIAVVYFDVLVPGAIQYDVDEEISYRVSSGLDAAVYIDGTVLTLVRQGTDVDDDNPDFVPVEFKLYQNHPNPFNPRTTISFDLPRRCDVVVEIYDLLGRTVENFDLGSRPAGHHAVEFDGTALASGIYFYRVQSRNFVAMRKMALIK